MANKKKRKQGRKQERRQQRDQKPLVPKYGTEPSSDQTPRAHQGPSSTQSPRTSEDPDEYLRMNPVWRFSDLLLDDAPFSWKGVQGKTLEKVVKRLGELEGKKFAEIKNTGSHEIDRGKLSEEFVAAVEVEGKVATLESIYSIRIEGKMRVFGFRYGHEIHIRWFDPEHKICPSQRKPGRL